MVSQGIIEYFKGDDPEDGLETLNIWVETLDMNITMAPKIAPAIAEAIEPFAQALAPKEQKRKRR